MGDNLKDKNVLEFLRNQFKKHYIIKRLSSKLSFFIIPQKSTKDSETPQAVAVTPAIGENP